jgi:hypothetical protein
MSNNNNKTKQQISFERVFEYEDCIVIWKYDNFKSNSGAYEVEIKPNKKKISTQ